MKNRRRALAGGVLLLIAACGGDGSGNDPTNVKFGDTVLVVVLNPVVNDANGVDVPVPGTARAGVKLTTDDGHESTTDAAGIAVLGPLAPGARAVALSGNGLTGSFSVTMTTGELREIALAADGSRADVMVEIDYKSDHVVELSPTMAHSAVNDALKVSDSVVFFKGGTYEGDLDFSGSRVTLFGAGVLGGEVTIHGTITVSGSDSRIRGAHIQGNLEIPASGVGLSFSQVDGTTVSAGSDATFLSNGLCGGATLTGSGTIALGNLGAPPAAACL